MSETASLRELVDLKELQAIQASFAKTVGISSVILSPECEPLTQFSNPTRFCSLIQSTEEGKRRCFLSFKEMSQKSLELKEQKIYYCFAHGGHFVAPIIINDEHKGTMFAGQFIPQKFSPEKLKEFEKLAVEINVDPQQLAEDAKKMRVVDEDVVWNYSSLLFQIVELISRLGAHAAEINRAKEALQKSHDELEIRVQVRTVGLSEANEKLKREVAERKAAEEALRESEWRFKELFENMSSGVAVYEAVDNGEDFVFMDFNHAAEKIDSIKKEDLLGKSVLKVFPGIRDFGLFALFQRVWHTGKPEHHPISFYKDERIVGWRENYVYKLPSGEIVAVYDDVTERKQTEEALQNSEAKFRTIIEKNPLGSLIVDKERKIREVNDVAAVMIGRPKEEILGGICHEFVCSRAQNDCPIYDHGQTFDHNEAIILSKDRGEVPIEKTVTQIKIDGDTMLLEMFLDITDRKRAEEELRKSMSELERFNRIAVDRELKMIELKKEINALLEQSGKETRYRITGEG